MSIMADISLEFWIWMLVLGIVNIVFFIYTMNHLIVSYRILATDPGIQMNGASPAQLFMQKMRWIALLLIILRIAFAILCGLNNGKLATDYTLDWNNIPQCTYLIGYYLIQEISSEGKVIYVILIFKRVSSLFLRIYSIDTISYRTDYKKFRRLKYVQYGGTIAIICDILHRIIDVIVWITDYQYHMRVSDYIWDIGLYALIFIIFWISFILFAYNYFTIRSKAVSAYNKASHAMPDYKKIYFQSVMNRAEHTGNLFLLWLIVYFGWTMVDISYHILKVLGLYDNRIEYHIALYWVYWILCDSILFLAILSYIKPQITTSILQKYRQINNRKRTQASVEQIY
eukprot:170533_1